MANYTFVPNSKLMEAGQTKKRYLFVNLMKEASKKNTYCNNLFGIESGAFQWKAFIKVLCCSLTWPRKIKQKDALNWSLLESFYHIVKLSEKEGQNI